MDQDRIVVGAPFGYGSASVYKFDGQEWISEVKLVDPLHEYSVSFGWAVAVQGTTIVVGIPGRDVSSLSAAGAAYLFEFDGQQWNQTQELLPSDSRADGVFGCSAAFGDGFVVIGAMGDDEHGTRAGAAYIFRDTGHGWVQEAKLVPQDIEPEDGVGMSVDASGDTVIVSAERDDDQGTDSGAAYIFRYDGQHWNEEAKLLPSDGQAEARFGWSVSILNSVAVAGAIWDDERAGGAGCAYVFRQTANGWDQEAKLLAVDGQAGEYLGWSVALTEPDTVLVGAKWGHTNGELTGSAYAYHYDGRQWTQGVRLSPPNPAGLMGFGSALTGQGGIGVAGQPNLGFSGVAFIFDLNCSGSTYHLSTTGLCPGDVTLEWSGATPHVQQAIAFGLHSGSTTIPPGLPCAGTILGVQGQTRLVNPPGYFSTSDGSGHLTGHISSGACGGFVQLIQGSDCSTSNVSQLP